MEYERIILYSSSSSSVAFLTFSSSSKEDNLLEIFSSAISSSVCFLSSPDNPGTYLYFEDNSLYLHFEQDCYRQSMQQPNIYNSIEINKSITTSSEIRETVKKRSKEFSK